MSLEGPNEKSRSRTRNNNRREELSRLPCPVCGAQDYQWGSLVGGPTFLDEEESVRARVKTIMSARRRTARRCIDCGNIQVFQ